ncbi:alanine--tRNA ligase [bacterium BMS3Bbin06]|nr:alanine--tRNA ligase [bacterium BMS3Bbin06]
MIPDVAGMTIQTPRHYKVDTTVNRPSLQRKGRCMNSKEVRENFLTFFRERGHEVVRSSNLIPYNDPSLLFTNAGMVQFKGVFLGNEKRDYVRATSCQKCMRAGGKHSDLENVGHTSRHHTFFEMLGNFSFGDYFKREAIQFAWELLTERYGLPKERLWVSVFEEDDEAMKLWTENTDISPSRIVRLGAEDNFWQMGDTGPCGPCSEILIDQGEETGCSEDTCAVGCDCDRYLELWNLVFMQYNRNHDGVLSPLPKPSIDTGMGLERLSAVLQGKLNNFDTDLFAPIITETAMIAGINYGATKETDVSLRVIADHVRAATFLLAEGLIPSNEGRGYVLRRIIRRASRHARILNIHEPCLYKLIEPVISVMGDAYPEIGDERERTEKLLRIEEDRFTRTLEMGMNILDEIISGIKAGGSRVIPGKEVFRLYDTYGFPLDLAVDIAMDEGIEVDTDGFRVELEKQRSKAKAHSEGPSLKEPFTGYPLSLKTEFTGYETMSCDARVVGIYREGKSVDELREGERGELVLDRTPFYGESGGQAGDTGIIDSENTHIHVIDTKKPRQDLTVHTVDVKRGGVRKGETVHASVNEELRHATMRNHTATHLLHRALKDVLGDHVKQSGSLVSPVRLRFDFTHFYALQQDEIEKVEEIVNEKILEDLPVRTEVMSVDDAIEQGAVALFDEKYGNSVRVVSAGDYSKELCGGTHCRSTGEIGPFVIISEGSVASGIRRIEALTGRQAFRFLNDKRKELERIRRILKTDKPVERVSKLLNELKRLEKELERLKTGASRDVVFDAVKNSLNINGVNVILLREKGLNHRELRMIADKIRDNINSGIIILTSENDGQAAIVCTVSDDLKERYNAGKIVRDLSSLAGGKGGGKKDMAQGGTKNPDKLKSAVEKIPKIISSL